LLNIIQPSSLLAQNLNLLQSRARESLQYLKATRIIKNGKASSLSVLPWYLVIGPKQSGKTSLLIHSDINYVREAHGSRSAASGSTCEWWITPENVIIDVPGSFTNVDDKKSSLNGEAWLYLLELIQKNQFNHNMSGIIFSLSVSQLLDDDYRDMILDMLKSTGKDLQNVFGRTLPFYFVINKADTLPGFLDYFGDSSIEDLSQAWGITMPTSIGSESVTSVFISRFNALIHILNKNMIRRLHMERSLQVKSAIKNFPLHVERIKDEFAHLLNSITSNNINLLLKGVYLTSSTQINKYETTTAYEEMAGVSDGRKDLLVHDPDNIAKHPYFIKQFLLNGVRA